MMFLLSLLQCSMGDCKRNENQSIEFLPEQVVFRCPREKKKSISVIKKHCFDAVVKAIYKY